MVRNWKSACRMRRHKFLRSGNFSSEDKSLLRNDGYLLIIYKRKLFKCVIDTYRYLGFGNSVIDEILFNKYLCRLNKQKKCLMADFKSLRIMSRIITLKLSATVVKSKQFLQQKKTWIFPSANIRAKICRWGNGSPVYPLVRDRQSSRYLYLLNREEVLKWEYLLGVLRKEAISYWNLFQILLHPFSFSYPFFRPTFLLSTVKLIKIIWKISYNFHWIFE